MTAPTVNMIGHQYSSNPTTYNFPGPAGYQFGGVSAGILPVGSVWILCAQLNVKSTTTITSLNLGVSITGGNYNVSAVNVGLANTSIYSVPANTVASLCCTSVYVVKVGDSGQMTSGFYANTTGQITFSSPTTFTATRIA
jgi:hypothetical protein